MTASSPAAPPRETADAPVSRPELLRVWALHLLCFVLPVTTLVFAVTGPHPRWVGLWLLPLALSIAADVWGPSERRQPASTVPGWPFDWVLYALVALQVTNVVLVARMVGITGFWSWQTLVAVVLVGTNSGYSGIVVGHELMHRREPHMRLLSRILMGTVLYEHFYTEHLRGHHARVGTDADPATARFGESFVHFFRRTVPAQFRSAWRLEARRLGNPDMRWWDPRLLRSRVVHGLAAEWAATFALAAFFGWPAFFFQVLQAAWAVRLLECVNYFEHWGLRRAGKRVSPRDSWDTDSWFTLYTLVGLSRHADHHAYPSRPYQQLRHWDESPKLPSGYFGMVLLAIARNQTFQRRMSSELRRRELGPWAPQATAGEAA
jgi:alkane 1-monooxygenase